MFEYTDIPEDIKEYYEYIVSLIEKSLDEHPLKIAYKNMSSYFFNFADSIIYLHKELNDKICNNLLIDKLQLTKKTFNAEQYYEAATEFSVILFMYCIGHNKFAYEETQKKGTDKQPECAVTSKTGKKFIAEAKCPVQHIDIQNPDDGNYFVFRNAGRADSLQEQKDFLKKMNIDFSAQNISVLQGKNSDNTMLDFLQSASQKFSENDNPDELNILFVALNTVQQIQEWVNFFYFNKGFFTSNSFAADEPYCYVYRKKKETYIEPHFKNIHLIVFTNNYYRHKNYNKINGSAWYLREGFNIVLENPFVNMKEKKETLKEFFNYLPTYSKNIQEYKVPCSPNTPLDAFYSVKIIDYVKAELEEKQGMFYWEKD